MQITGPNGAGKTSVLDAVWACLNGRPTPMWSRSAPVRPPGRSSLQLGGDAVEMVVTRTFRRKKDPESGEEIKQTADITV